MGTKPVITAHRSGGLGVTPTQDVFMQRYSIKPQPAYPNTHVAQRQMHTTNLLGEGPPLHREDDAVLAPDSDGGRTLPDGLHGVLDLEEMAVGAEDGDGAVVAHVGVLANGEVCNAT